MKCVLGEVYCCGNIEKMAEKQRKLSLEQEEVLDFRVKEYPCLIDKTDKGYKEKDCVANAWKEVADSLEFIENGENFNFVFRLILL